MPPTYKPLSIPFTSIVNIRGDRLYHEHIAWDQGTVLRQLGLLPEYLPFPHALAGEQRPGMADKGEKAETREMDEEGGRVQYYRVPVAGVETARKLVDENAWPSNEMIAREVRSEEGNGQAEQEHNPGLREIASGSA